MSYETEVKFYIAQPQQMEAALQAAGAVLQQPRIFESNLRYDSPDASFTANGIVLRLRQDSRCRLTYKAPASPAADGLSTRLELETEVSDFAAMDAILRHLGYQHSLVYEKYRSSYQLHGAEVVLDELPYGHFVEIEGQPSAIEACIRVLGLAGARRILASYTDLFQRVRLALGLDFRDLTFANFAGHPVPPDLFNE